MITNKINFNYRYQLLLKSNVEKGLSYILQHLDECGLRDYRLKSRQREIGRVH